MFSAYGGIRTGKIMPVLAVYFLLLALGILEKGGLFVAPPPECCIAGAWKIAGRTGIWTSWQMERAAK